MDVRHSTRKLKAVIAAKPPQRCRIENRTSLSHSQSHQGLPVIVNEYRSCRGTWWRATIQSPVRMCNPVSGSPNKAEGPPTCQYSSNSGSTNATDVNEGSQRRAGGLARLA